MMRLPGHAYPGADRDGFTHRDGVEDFIAAYAVRIAAPVRCGVNVNAVELTDTGRFRVEAGPMTMEAVNVVVATGPFQSPRIPEAAAHITEQAHEQRLAADHAAAGPALRRLGNA